MRIYYETGKGKEKIYLDQPPYWMQTGDFLDYLWEYELSGKRVGKLRKTVQEKEFTITVFGNTKEQYAKNLNLLHEALEKDILENTPGRFTLESITCPVTFLPVKRPNGRAFLIPWTIPSG